jgi:predicted ATPase
MGVYIDRVLLKKSIDEPSYIKALPVVRRLAQLRELPLTKPVTIFVGENGTGKSTLLEAIAVCAGFNAEGGSKNFDFSTKSTESPLHKYLTLSRSRREQDGFFLRAESFYNAATYIESLDGVSGYGSKSLHEQSHGESFMALIQNRFFGQGLYILDEPEAALSPLRQMTLLGEIDRLVKEDSQFIISTHSPILLACPGAIIYELTESDIRQTEYRQTEHYSVTKQFLDNPERMLRYLLEDI